MHKKTSLTEAIIKRLSEISSDEEAFNEAAPPYQEALPKSGYSHTLKIHPTKTVFTRINHQKEKVAEEQNMVQPTS